MQFWTINQNGRDNLIEWIAGELAARPHLAPAFADDLIANFDGSDIDASQIVELRGFYTRTGNPATYRFGPSELTLTEQADS